MSRKVVTNEELLQIRQELSDGGKNKVTAWQIAGEINKRKGEKVHESTIRGRFIEMGQPLSGGIGPKTIVIDPAEPTKQAQPFVMKKTERLETVNNYEHKYEIPDNLKPFIPDANMFTNYIERPTDKRLALHYNLKKYPLTQGKQGTGKTFSHMHYAYKAGLPFFLYSCYEDFKLRKLFGDKTIKEGTIEFKEGLFVQAIQHPSVILFDEVNAISNANSFDFHALLQNRELFVKDANNGHGKVYKLHPECRIGFAQNPKSAKYIGGNIKPSNFLGRCTFITFPEFTTNEIKKALQKKYPQLEKADLDSFVKFYFACIQLIDEASLPLDISIRQLNNVVDLWYHGLPLKEAIEDGLASMLEAVSNPTAKESFIKLGAAIWKELMI